MAYIDMIPENMRENKYQILVEDKEYYLAPVAAAKNLNSYFSRVTFGGKVMEKDGSVREITKDEKNAIYNVMDEYDSDK